MNRLNRVVRWTVAVALSATVLSPATRANASAASDRESPTSKEISLRDVTLTSRGLTQWSFEFQGKAGRTYSVMLTDGTNSTPEMVIRAPRRCIGKWCKLSGRISMSADMSAAALTVHTRDTTDMIGIQLFDPFTWQAMSSFATGGASAMGIPLNTLRLCSGFAWETWTATSFERQQIAGFYKRRTFAAKFTVAAIAASATVQEWNGVNRSSLVSGKLAVKIGSKVAGLAGKAFSGTWEDLLPSPQQITALSNELGWNAIKADEICTRRGL